MIKKFLPNNCKFDLYEEIDSLIPDLNIRNLGLPELVQKVK